jgi:hypothetical protein
MTIDPFDALGRLRTDFSEAEIAALPPDDREKFFALVKGYTENEAAEEEQRAADADVRACVVNRQLAQNAHNAAHPPTDRIDELRKVIAAGR